MLALNPAVWMRESALGPLKPRSSLLKALDRAIQDNFPLSTWAKSGAVAKALRAWTSANSSSERLVMQPVTRLQRELALQLSVLAVKPDFNWANPAFAPYLQASLLNGVAGKRARQAALDAIPLPVAKLEKVALNAMITAYPDAIYTAVESFTGVVTPCTVVPAVVGTKFVYSSAEYDIHAEIFCIAPANAGWHIGLIQHCNSKEDIATYSDGSHVEDFTPLSFPIGDSAGVNHQPWYCKGLSSQCQHNTYGMFGEPWADTVRLQLHDGFPDNHHFQKVFPPGVVNGVPPATPGSIKTAKRTQEFQVWLALQDPSGEFRLLRTGKYTINCSATLTGAHVTTHGTSVSNTSFSTCLPHAVLPAVSAQVMNGQSVWRYRASASAPWVPLVTT